MSDTSNWGQCLQCKWWQIEPDATLATITHGLCISEALESFRLRVSGGSGCNGFAKGVPARVAGSGNFPPLEAHAR